MPEIDRKKLAILRALDSQSEPVGSSRLAQELANLGVDLATSFSSLMRLG